MTEKKVTVDLRRPVLERLNEIAAHRELVTCTIKVPRLDFAEVAD